MIAASIDAGTNTVLMTIAKEITETKSLEIIHEEHRFPRLGEGIESRGKISDEKIKKFTEILLKYVSVSRYFSARKVLLTGTSVFRRLDNIEEVKKIILEETGLSLKVLTSEEEAKLSFLGATSEIVTDKNVVMIDIGGGSTEVTLGNKTDILFSQSFETGVVRLSNMFCDVYPPGPDKIEGIKAYIEKITGEIVLPNSDEYIGVGIAGTPITLSCIANMIREFRKENINNQILTIQQISIITKTLLETPISEMENKFGEIIRGREDLLLFGSLILQHIMGKLNLSKLVISTNGLRQGVLLQHFFKIFDKYSVE
ncbi:MAG: hypothetical protein IAE91_12780 [Ignavibacteriaceae bacterium]|nr:hypothetical protein [Ignavibacteriaceae bacterium]